VTTKGFHIRTKRRGGLHYLRLRQQAADHTTDEWQAIDAAIMRHSAPRDAGQRHLRINQIVAPDNAPCLARGFKFYNPVPRLSA
jgi:hypothetical protein